MGERWTNGEADERQGATANPPNNFVSGLRSMETSHRPTLMLRCKVAVVGDACVGKSALVQLFHKGAFPKNYVMTSWVDFCVKQVNIPDTNAAVELYLFDCAGQSVFSTTEANIAYFDNVSAVMAVYDVSNKESFDSMRTWLSKVRSRRPPTAPPLPGVLVANKVDLRGDEDDFSTRGVITQKQGYQFAQAEGLEFFETSAVEQRQNEDPFHFIADQFYRKYQETVKLAEGAVADM